MALAKVKRRCCSSWALPYQQPGLVFSAFKAQQHLQQRGLRCHAACTTCQCACCPKLSDVYVLQIHWLTAAAPHLGVMQRLARPHGRAACAWQVGWAFDAGMLRLLLLSSEFLVGLTLGEGVEIGDADLAAVSRACPNLQRLTLHSAPISGEGKWPANRLFILACSLGCHHSPEQTTGPDLYGTLSDGVTSAAGWYAAGVAAVILAGKMLTHLLLLRCTGPFGDELGTAFAGRHGVLPLQELHLQGSTSTLTDTGLQLCLSGSVSRPSSVAGCSNTHGPYCMVCSKTADRSREACRWYGVAISISLLEQKALGIKRLPSQCCCAGHATRCGALS